MSVNYKVVTNQHVKMLSDNMRQSDVNELTALTSIPIYSIVKQSVLSSSLCASAYVDGELNAILGVCPASSSIINTVGVPWLLATDDMAKNKKEFCSEYDRIIKQMLSEYSLLENYVDANNIEAIRFLNKAGFKLHVPKPIGINGALFHKFTMRA